MLTSGPASETWSGRHVLADGKKTAAVYLNFDARSDRGGPVVLRIDRLIPRQCDHALEKAIGHKTDVKLARKLYILCVAFEYIVHMRNEYIAYVLP